ncbi:MAG: aldose 1-epimerase family protein [Actinomycetota bacterium]|nr:aldose 1-epimerase family protein [Actinomycetota bacterium]
MRLPGGEVTRRELLRRVGNPTQVGGVELVRHEEGHARGVRSLIFRTGAGLSFAVVPDRGLDVGAADFAETGLCWLPPKGLAGPWYYEGDLDPTAWLRVGLGGLCNTAGLVSIGVPQEIDTSSFGFTQRLSARYGTHDRISVTPASHFSYDERWEDDRLVLSAEGVVRQDIAYGENLSLRRRYETEVGSSRVSMLDVVTNEGWFETPHQILYHFNLGFPLVDEGAEILAAVDGKPRSLGYSVGEDDGSDSWRSVTAPQSGFTFGGYEVSLKADAVGKVAVALVNRGLRGGLGFYLRYDGRQLPTYLAWRMMREGLYAIGLEPATNPFGNPSELIEQGYPLMLAPGERRTYELEWGILEGVEEIDAFAASLEVLR